MRETAARSVRVPPGARAASLLQKQLARALRRRGWKAERHGELLRVYSEKMPTIGESVEVIGGRWFRSSAGAWLGEDVERAAEAVDSLLMRWLGGCAIFLHMSDEWQKRVDDLWDVFDDHEPAEFLGKMEALVAERDDALGLFELASAHDSIGNEEQAAPLYRAALAAGLPSGKRRQAVIQMASTIRNLGEIEESIALLRAERDAGSDELDDAVVAFLALALADAGREREGLSLALGALAGHLPLYSRSLANYAMALND